MKFVTESPTMALGVFLRDLEFRLAKTFLAKEGERKNAYLNSRKGQDLTRFESYLFDLRGEMKPKNYPSLDSRLHSNLMDLLDERTARGNPTSSSSQVRTSSKQNQRSNAGGKHHRSSTPFSQRPRSTSIANSRKSRSPSRVSSRLSSRSSKGRGKGKGKGKGKSRKGGGKTDRGRSQSPKSKGKGKGKSKLNKGKGKTSA